MTAFTFDTLEFSKTLQKAGMSQAQADAFAAAQKTALDQMTAAREIATQADVQKFEHALKTDILRLEAKIEETKRELHIGLTNAKNEMLKWLMGLIVAQTALIVAVLAYVK